MSFWKNPFKSVAGTVGKSLNAIVKPVISAVVEPFVDTKTKSAIQQQDNQVKNQLKLDSSLLNYSTGFNPNAQKSGGQPSTQTLGTNVNETEQGILKYMPYLLGVLGLGSIFLIVKK